MKIELDVNEEQLQELDKGLTNLLTTLTKDQQIDLIQKYMMVQMDKLYIKEESDYWNRNKQELTAFGEQLQENLSKNMVDVMYKEIIQHKGTQKIMDDTIKEVENNLYGIIEKSITKYIIEHLFTDKGYIQSMISNNIQEVINNLETHNRLR